MNIRRTLVPGTVYPGLRNFSLIRTVRMSIEAFIKRALVKVRTNAPGLTGEISTSENIIG